MRGLGEGHKKNQVRGGGWRVAYGNILIYFPSRFKNIIKEEEDNYQLTDKTCLDKKIHQDFSV